MQSNTSACMDIILMYPHPAASCTNPFLYCTKKSYSDDMDLRKFGRKTIPDDPQLPELRQFKPGYVSYAGSGVNSRDTQLFVSYGSAKSLGTQPWETPLGEVIDGMENIKSFNSEYKEQPKQGRIHGGSKYIEENFPNLDKFETCTVKRSTLIATGEEKAKDQKLTLEGKVIKAKKPVAVAEKRPAPVKTEESDVKEKSDKLQAGTASARLGSKLSSPNGRENTRLVLGLVALLGFLFVVKKKLSGPGRSKKL
mmetsp:Transcript_31508/g.64103  ORF Transcript_31508/g.64103 Transcript_31508/m.64103 type:complete len:253 (+) Transcript_31508:40-798(+)